MGIGRMMAATALALLAAGCVTRPANTDLFGRPLTPADGQSVAETTAAAPDASAAAAPPTAARTRPTPAPARTAGGTAPPRPVGRTAVPQSNVASSGAGTGGTTAAPDDLLNGVALRPPSAAPAWSPAPVTTNAVTVAAREYIVVAGDTLRGIGNRTGAGSEAIARANSLIAPYILNVGQRIAIPGGRYHDVQAGQTGIAIARAYGVDWAQVVADNGLVEPFTLRVGQKLRLPAGANPTRPLTMEEQAQAFTLDIDDIMTGGRPAGPATAASTTTRAASTAATPRGASASASAASSGAASAAPSGGGALAGTIRFVWPLRGAIVQHFGAAGGGRVNDGINIAAVVGAPVHASAAGTVAYSGSEIGPLGGLVLIDHGNGWVSAYGHLDRVAVRSGERVVADTVIGTAGETGQVQSPQLHFQIRQNRRPVDPMRYLPAR